MNLAEIVIYGLATFRLSYMLVNEAGPFHIFYRFRQWAGIRHNDDKLPEWWEDGFFTNLLTCIYCNSVWVAILFMGLYYLSPSATLVFASWLAISSMAILANEFSKG